MGYRSAATALLAQCLLACPAAAVERAVSSTDELSQALEAAVPGDTIVLEPGTYDGGLYRENLKGVSIQSADVLSPAVIKGGSFGMMLSDPVDVTISGVAFVGQSSIGLNIDDGGSYETPARNITIKNVAVRDMVKKGNHDGIKLAGVEDFVIDGVKVENWGSGGSAIDFVGCHRGVVQNSYLKHKSLDVGGSGIRPKGGTKDVIIRANRIELPIGKGRAIQAGGVTDAEFFRFVEGDGNYEAKDIVAVGNVVIGGGSAASWVNIDGGIFHRNLIYRPGQWVGRILNENTGTDLVVTQSGVFHDNRIAFNDTADEFNTAINVGDETMAETFKFARNRWLNLADPTPEGSTPKLPSDEEDGVYGEALDVSIDAPQIWDFPWGIWIVNANQTSKIVTISETGKLLRAVSGRGAAFDPLAEIPLAGVWVSKPVTEGKIEMGSMSQLILVNPKVCGSCFAER